MSSQNQPNLQKSELCRNSSNFYCHQKVLQCKKISQNYKAHTFYKIIVYKSYFSFKKNLFSQFFLQVKEFFRHYAKRIEVEILCERSLKVFLMKIERTKIGTKSLLFSHPIFVKILWLINVR